MQLLGEQLLLQPAPIDRHRFVSMGIFSVIFTLNIALGNVSLQHVSVNFNQVVRSLVPAVTMWLTLYALRKPISVARQRAVWPVVLGVALACAGDRDTVTVIGLVYTLLSVALAAVKVVASSKLLTEGARNYHPVVLLQLLAPWALGQCLVLAVVTGEVALIRERWNRDLNPVTTGDWTPVSVLVLSGFLAFGLNISAFQAYKLTSPLTCCIAAAVKQVFMIVLGTMLFRTPVSVMNAMGIVVVLVASAYYSYISVWEQQRDAGAQTTIKKVGEGDLQCCETSSESGDDEDTEGSLKKSLLVVEMGRENRSDDCLRRGAIPISNKMESTV